jgi:hypothetical protein
MHHPRSLARSSPRLLIAGLALLGLALPASPDPRAAAQTEAAKVAKKVEKARNTKHQDKEDVDAVAEFQKEVSRYAALHDRLIAKLSAERPATAADLAGALMAARAQAKPGDILVDDVQPLFKRLIAEQLTGPDALAARKALAEGNPDKVEDTVKVDVRVNAPYPSGAVHSTVPSSLLLTLPTLPACLHYRFVGRDLILVDSVAQLIVDYLKAATPPTPATPTTPKK